MNENLNELRVSEKSVNLDAKVTKSRYLSSCIVYLIGTAVLVKSIKTGQCELWEKVDCPVLPDSTVTSVPTNEFPESNVWVALSIEY